jgi:thiosulfate/3-mercaptopyruvate sulfurtransferase
MRLSLLLSASLLSITLYGQGFKDIMIDQSQFQKISMNDNVVVIHVGRAEGYNKGHIPDALFIGNVDYITVSDDSLYTELPKLEDFQATLKSRGINKESQIVLCSDWETFAQAFRLYFTFEYFGFNDNVRILDGGIKGWDAKGLPVSTDTAFAVATKEDIVLKENTNLLVDKNWIKNSFNNEEVTIIDARTPEYFSGEKDGDGYYKRSGHIAGAINITWKNLVDENHFLLDEKSLMKNYKDLGIGKDQSVINYCHVGLRATVLYTVSKGLGYSTFLYDGSYNEWDRLGEEYSFEKSDNE